MSVKVELDTVCRGCLSVDRKIVPLKNNVSLFFILIADQYIPKDSKYFNMYLCWECVALLRKVALFQKQIQKSKDIFLENFTQPRHMESMSHLKTVHKNKYDFTIEYEEGDLKVNELLEYDKIIKEETYDIFDNNTELFDGSDYIDNIDSEKVKEKKIRKTKSKVKTTEVIYTDEERDRYMSRVQLSVKELEMLESNKRGRICGMSYRCNVLVKKMLSAKRRDVRNCANSEPICSQCEETFTSNTVLLEHWQRHVITMYKCHFCSYHGDDGDDVMAHLKQKHIKIYTCKCGIEFRSIRDYYKHNKSLHKNFDCDHCDRRFQSKATIEKHMLQCHLPYTCNLCHRNYKSYKVLMNHYFVYHAESMRKVKQEKPYCVECDMTFENEYLYKRHLRSAVAHRPKIEVKVPCPECGKVFSRKTYMTNHYNLVHVRKSKHYCEICDKYFITGYAIRTHKKFVHEKREKPKDKICEICDRGFFTNRVLINHRRTHTGERPYKCAYCPAAFAQRSAMKTHERTQHKNYINS
ncbi:zinc finger protein 420-like [Nymphalis io]|uniref:zinc finger protein 420-like n=1 Tax=Inachis io TaxID=171585 RepID=UPI002169BC69|nr:zinc finger protein 420-like [Nymphalis io]